MPEKRPGFENVRVLITVKTYPASSARHGETVCIAGVRLHDDHPPTFIRLYPVPFRLLEDNSRCAKYQIIEVPARSRGTKDRRPESLEPAIEEAAVGTKIDTRKKWAAPACLHRIAHRIHKHL